MITSSKVHPFEYAVRQSENGVELTITQFNLRRLRFALLWMFVWLAAAIVAYLLLQRSYFIIVLIICLLLEWQTLFVLVRARLVRTLILMPNELVLRSSFFGLSRATSLVPSNVKFGFGAAGHSCVPVIKLERGSRWTILAEWVAQSDVQTMLSDTRSRGFLLPE